MAAGICIECSEEAIGYRSIRLPSAADQYAA